MNTTNQTLTRWRVSQGLFAFGLVMAVLVTFATFWPNMEASLFDTGTTAEESLPTLSCPRVLSADETSQISVTINNPLERQATLLVRARISEGRLTLQRQFSGYVDLAPGETRELSWEISPADAVYNRVIMASVYTGPSRPIPNRQGSCGVLVLPFGGLSGELIMFSAIAFSLVTMGVGGVGLWQHSSLLKSNYQLSFIPIAILMVLVLVSLLMGLFSLWVGAILVLILALLMLVIILEKIFAT